MNTLFLQKGYLQRFLIKIFMEKNLNPRKRRNVNDKYHFHYHQIASSAAFTDGQIFWGVSTPALVTKTRFPFPMLPADSTGIFLAPFATYVAKGERVRKNSKIITKGFLNSNYWNMRESVKSITCAKRNDFPFGVVLKKVLCLSDQPKVVFILNYVHFSQYLVLTNNKIRYFKKNLWITHFFFKKNATLQKICKQFFFLREQVFVHKDLFQLNIDSFTERKIFVYNLKYSYKFLKNNNSISKLEYWFFLFYQRQALKNMKGLWFKYSSWIARTPDFTFFRKLFWTNFLLGASSLFSANCKQTPSLWHILYTEPINPQKEICCQYQHIFPCYLYSIKCFRPLFVMTRLDTFYISQLLQLPVYPDTSNLQIKFLRNRVRKQMLPAMRILINPQCDAILCKLSTFI